jgi:O-antigen chain-terminating methyltransferase
MEPPNPESNPEEALREIRDRVRSKWTPQAVLRPSAGGMVGAALAPPDWGRLKAACDSVIEVCLRLGRLPPAPPTWRGRLGALLVRLVRRMLFWYTPQIAELGAVTKKALSEQLDALENAWRTGADAVRLAELLSADLERLEPELRAAREAGIQTHLELTGTSAALQALRAQLTSYRDRLGEAERQSGLEIAAHEALSAQLASQVERSRRLQEGVSAAITAGEVLHREIDSESAHRRSLEEGLRKAEQELAMLRAQNLVQERRITALHQQQHRWISEAFEQDRIKSLAPEDPHRHDALYCSCENQFRGTREELTKHLQVYLPYLRQANVGGENMPILDLGCGRGEWLELLRTEGFHARGVEANRVMVALCRDRGLDVVESDLLSFLRSLPDCSVGAVTGFHVIEHLPWETLVDVLDEAVRTLQPDGLAIFETPNPLNVLVSSHSFYQDPTHRNPLPSSLVRFLAQARGLSEIEVLLLSPIPDSAKVFDAGPELVERFNHYFYAAQDYALVARKIP